MATPKPTQNTAKMPQIQTKAAVPTVNCPTCISGIDPSTIGPEYRDILKG